MNAQETKRTRAWLVVIGGVLAWIVVLVVVLLVALRDDDPDTPQVDADSVVRARARRLPPRSRPKRRVPQRRNMS